MFIQILESDVGITSGEAIAEPFGLFSRSESFDSEETRQAFGLLGQHAKVGEEQRSHQSQRRMLCI